MEQKQYRVAVYCRVASADQLSMDTQKDHLRRYAAKIGFNCPNFYMDNGYSGLNYNRPAFSRLEADIKAGLLDAVIVRNQTRIGRNVFETAHWIDRLRSNGVAFIEADLPFGENYLQNRYCIAKWLKENNYHERENHTGRRIHRPAFKR